MDSQSQPAPNEEKIIWEGHSSQVVNLPIFILCVLAAGFMIGVAIVLRDRFRLVLAGAALVPAIIALAKWLQNQCRRYQVSTERFHLRQGVFSRKTDDV